MRKDFVKMGHDLKMEFPAINQDPFEQQKGAGRKIKDPLRELHLTNFYKNLL